MEAALFWAVYILVVGPPVWLFCKSETGRRLADRIGFGER